MASDATTVLNSSADEEVVTMQDALKDMQSELDENIAVFGAGDEENCTYTLGYMERQAVFCCKTCDPLFSNPTGVCYGCSIHCHDGHDLIELYTKRNFKCDCGNSKVDEMKCTLQPEKDAVNDKNKYNQNYRGLYCTCNRPYPDPDDPVDDEMIQCVICEDWFHSRHLGTLPPPSYAEMTCDVCIKEHKFLTHYKHLTEPSVTVLKTVDETSGSAVVDVMTSSCTESGSKKRKYEDGQTDDKQASDCKLENMKTNNNIIDGDEQDALTVMFWKENWRQGLCRCHKCHEMYEAKGISFITKESDTIAVYEQKGKLNADKAMEDAATSISQMDRVQQVELMHGYNDLKSKLNEFFDGFDKDRVIRTEDVKNFFEDLNNRKRQYTDGPPPGACR